MRKSIKSVFWLIFFTNGLIGQNYFPPINTDTWETVDPMALNWNGQALDSLMYFLERNDTKAFIILKNGRIAVENYFGDFRQDSTWYWASAGKTLTAFTVGLAQQEGYLDIHNPTSDYLGTGWTSLDPDLEKDITVYHQLSMTSGLDDADQSDCTDPQCLKYLAPPGDRWAYHNAPYTLLQDVVSNAIPLQNFNLFFSLNLRNRIGMQGGFLPVGFNRVYFSHPRSMARFGLLILAKGTWDNDTILSDSIYFNEMTRPSNSINQSYGYLWWLNGQQSFMLPGTQFMFNGHLFPDAPSDMFAALGLNSQVLCVVPSEGLVVIRMGDEPSEFNGITGPDFTNAMWTYLSEVIGTSTSSLPVDRKSIDFKLYPNPARDVLFIKEHTGQFDIINLYGQIVNSQFLFEGDGINISILSPGQYILQHRSTGRQSLFIKQ